MKILVFLLLFAFAEPLKLEDVDISKMAEVFVRGNRLSLKEILDGLTKNLVGHKKVDVPLVELDPGNRLEDVVIESNISDIFVDAGDALSKLHIRNLTVPVSRLTVGGEYTFEELSLFDLVIYGRGDIKVDISDLGLFFSMTADYKSSSGWKVKCIDIDASVGDSLIRLENLMNGEPMGDFLNFMVDELFKVGIGLLNGLVQQYQNEICQVVGDLMNFLFDS